MPPFASSYAMHDRSPKHRAQLARPFARTAAIGTALFGTAGCGGITASSPEAAQVRFVQASADAPTLDMYLDKDGAAYNLSIGTVTSYLSLSPGEYRVSAHRSGAGQALVSAQAQVNASRQYTAVISNSLASLQELVFPDINVPAPPGTVAVRVIDTAALGGPIDVYLLPLGATPRAASPLVRELAFGTATGYEQIAAGRTYTVVPATSGSSPRKASSPLGVTLSGASGAVRTVIITDAGATSGKGLTALVLNDDDDDHEGNHDAP